MKLLMREIQQHVMEQLKIPNKVTSGYVGETIQEIIRHTKYGR
jgi:hypothetical protein